MKYRQIRDFDRSIVTFIVDGWFKIVYDDQSR